MIKSLTYKKLNPNSEIIENIVIFLHGYGANSDDLLNIGQMWKTDLPNTLFVSPNAPFRCAWGGESYQWFDLTSIAPEKIGEGLETAGPYLNKFIEEISEDFKINTDKILIVGFSQGTMMALHHLCKRDNDCAGIMGYSGLLFENNNFDNEIKSKFPIRLFHGLDDEVINSDFTSKAYAKFKSLGFEIDYTLQKNLGHGIDENGLNYGIKFIKKVFNL